MAEWLIALVGASVILSFDEINEISLTSND